MSDETTDRIPSWQVILTGVIAGTMFPGPGPGTVAGALVAAGWCFVRHRRETAPERERRRQEAAKVRLQQPNPEQYRKVLADIAASEEPADMQEALRLLAFRRYMLGEGDTE